MLFARSLVCLAALGRPPRGRPGGGRPRDAEDFLADAQAGRPLGYQGKTCIHPRQVALAHRVFTPTGGGMARARDVLAAGTAGVGVLDGQIIDDVHVRMARAVLARAAQPKALGRPAPRSRTRRDHALQRY